MLPVIRQYPWYPGQLGVAGSDDEMGLRSRSGGFAFYVNNVHPNASDNNDGTDPAGPLSTITQAVTNLNAWHARYGSVGSLSGVGSFIVVSSNCGWERRPMRNVGAMKP